MLKQSILKTPLLVLAVSGVGIMSVPALADDYAINTKSASINFSIKHLGYSILTGRFDTFSGEFSYDPAKLEASTVNVTIDTGSINTNHAERDKGLRGPDFLNVEKFPKATFVSTKVVLGDDKGEFDIVGDLTLNGVTKSVKIEVEKIGEGKDPWGGYRAGFSGETTITLKDFNVKMDLGPASQTVQLELNVEGVKK